MSPALRTYRFGLILVMAAAVSWSTSGLFMRALTVDTPTILFWREAFGALVLAAVTGQVLWESKRGRGAPSVKREERDLTLA